MRNFNKLTAKFRLTQRKFASALAKFRRIFARTKNAKHRTSFAFLLHSSVVWAFIVTKRSSFFSAVFCLCSCCCLVCCSMTCIKSWSCFLDCSSFLLSDSSRCFCSCMSSIFHFCMRSFFSQCNLHIFDFLLLVLFHSLPHLCLSFLFLAKVL